MIYIYRPHSSESARELAEGITLLGTLARRTKGRMLATLRLADKVVCWGAYFLAGAQTKTLNNQPLISKFAEAEKLTAAQVPTVTVSRTRPTVVATARPAFVEPTYAPPLGVSYQAATVNQLRYAIDTFVQQRTAAYTAWSNTPVQPAETWLPRKNNHVGGNDLLNPSETTANFWSKKEALVEEYRLHMFRGKSIRAGKKFANPTRPNGRTAPHTWIRSYDGGWVIKYDNFESTRDMRKLARKALKALGLDFGAVDIGKKADGSLLVLEVNRAPGLEGNTTTAYATHIASWVANPDAVENDD